MAYTAGAVLYGLGRERAWMRCVFHVFCLAGTLLQCLAAYLFML